MQSASIEADFCPKCGGKPVLTRVGGMFQINCETCMFYVSHETLESAVKSWNSYERDIRI